MYGEGDRIVTKLFKCELTSNIRKMPDSIEYLRCKSQKILETMFTQCFNFEGSMYYGYHRVKITPIKISNFPEVMTMKINCNTVSNNRSEGKNE